MKVHLKLEFNWDIKLGSMTSSAACPAAVATDEWVIRGNHYDAWVNGAYDPISGQVCLLEEARALGHLAQQGWKAPAHDSSIARWDREEPMLLGSTEWVETHAEELRQHAVAYINSGRHGPGFSQSRRFAHFWRILINTVAHDIADPEVNMNIWGNEIQAFTHCGGGQRWPTVAEIRDWHADLQLDALGSGE